LFVGRWSPSAPPNPQNKTGISNCAISDFSATLLAKMHSDIRSDLRGPVVTAKINSDTGRVIFSPNCVTTLGHSKSTAVAFVYLDDRLLPAERRSNADVCGSQLALTGTVFGASKIPSATISC
jgi:hypothetical protein